MTIDHEWQQKTPMRAFILQWTSDKVRYNDRRGAIKGKTMFKTLYGVPTAYRAKTLLLGR